MMTSEQKGCGIVCGILLGALLSTLLCFYFWTLVPALVYVGLLFVLLILGLMGF